MRIFIPTKGRPMEDQITYQRIKESGRDLLSKYRVSLVVEHEYEREYFLGKGIPPDRVLVTGVWGIGAARQWIIENSDDNKVLMLDDDLKSWAVRTLGGSFVKSIDAPRIGFEWMDQALNTLAHAGIGPRQYANSKEDVVHCYRPLRALGYRADVINRLGLRFTLPLMEDFEMALKLLTKKLPNQIYYGVVQDQLKSGMPGGCTGMRTLELQAECARKLYEMFPRFVTLKYVDGWELGTRVDVSVQWKRAYNEC